METLPPFITIHCTQCKRTLGQYNEPQFRLEGSPGTFCGSKCSKAYRKANGIPKNQSLLGMKVPAVTS